MRNLTQSILLAWLVGVFFSPALYAQATHDLTGTWTVDFDQTLLDMTGSSRTTYDSMSTKTKQIMQQGFETRTFAFNSNNTVAVHFVIDTKTQDVSGQWSYAQPGDLLTITVDGAASEFDVSWQDNDHIKFNYHHVPAKALIKSLTLSRN